MQDKRVPTTVSRLQLVREGHTEIQTPTMPRRGRVIVDIDTILPDPANERKVFRDIAPLAQSIATVGIVEPPTVVPADQPGRYILTTGERRWRAARQAGLKRIAVIVNDTEDERTRRLKSLISNIHRADLSPLEVAHALQAMKDDQPEMQTNRALAGHLGKSEQWVGAMLKLLSLSPEMQQALTQADKPIPYDIALEIARIPEPRQQRMLLQAALQGATVRHIKERAGALKRKQGKKSHARTGTSYAITNEHVTVRVTFSAVQLSQEVRLEALRMAFEDILEIEERKK